MSAEFAGGLGERIVIERRSPERDASGLQQEVWQRVCACRAAIIVDGVGAQSQGQALSAMQRYRVTIRRRDGMEIDQRISWGERKMMVRQLLDDPLAKDRITMRCEEVRA